MSRRTNRHAAPRSGGAAAAELYMQSLREAHAGLSRVLREIDAQQSLLQSAPGAARPVLAEALRYLLVYQHSIHHPREDRLFARVRSREPLRHRRSVRERLARGTALVLGLGFLAWLPMQFGPQATSAHQADS